MKSAIITCVALAVLGAVPLAAGEPAAPPAQPQSKSILSVKSYWRHHQTYHYFQCVDKAGNFVYCTWYRYAARNNGWCANMLKTDDPPAGWEKPEFDDSAWCVQRMPFGLAPQYELQDTGDGAGSMVPLTIRRYAFRARFLAPDPARVTKLRLRLDYCGGVIACVNGREVARGHVAKDAPLSTLGYGEMYPDEAYDRNAPAATRRRTLEVEVPRDILVRGVNVLTLDSRISPIRDKRINGFDHCMLHSGLEEVALISEPQGAVFSDAGPEKPQVWVDDIHRWIHSPEYLEAGVRERRVMEIVGARNGAFSGQVVIRAAGEALAQPTASLGELTTAGGAKLPASGVRLRWGLGTSLFGFVSSHGGGFNRQGPKMDLSRYSSSPKTRYNPETHTYGKGGVAQGFMSTTKEHNNPNLLIFDQLVDRPPATVPANTAQPLWVTVSVPKDATPGDYRGVLALRAGGLSETKVDVLVRVSGAVLPEPREFVGYTGVDESPWALAKGCKVELWSDRHWKLIEESVRRAGELGARVVGIPAIQDTELNNDKDTMIRWIRNPSTGSGQGGDGYDYDFALVDKYLELWKKHCHSQSDVIVYLVLPADHQGKSGGTGSVMLADPVTKRESAFTPPNSSTPEGLKLWVDYAKAIHAHLKVRGFKDDNIHWGLFYDFCSEDTKVLAEALAKECPGVGWATSRHDPSNPFPKGSAAFFSWRACVRGYTAPFSCGAYKRNGEGVNFRSYADYKVVSGMGWKNPKNPVVLSRADTGITAMGGPYSPLWQLRQVQETAISAKDCRGVGRFCIDGWGRGSYFGPYIPFLLYPGADGGLDGSVQFEIVREGFQESEARIALEKRGALPADVQKMLDERLEWTYTLPCYPWARIAEFNAGWQARSRALYEAAGK